MNYFIARTSATVGTLKRSIEENDQRIFPLVDENQVYQGLVYDYDLHGCEDDFTAGELLAMKIDSGQDRNIFILATEASTEAKEILHIKRLQFVPILDRDHRIVGTIDESS